MIQTKSLLPQLDPVAERRRALAKVYRLLLRLAEEAEAMSTNTEIPVAVTEKIGAPVLATKELTAQ